MEISGQKAWDFVEKRPAKEQNASERSYIRLSKELQMKPDPRIDLIDFNILDNNLIDSVYSNIMTIQ